MQVSAFLTSSLLFSFFSSVLLFSSAHAAVPTQVQVFTEINGTLVPLAYSLATDSAGRRFTADSKGRLELRLAEGSVTVEFDSAQFKVTRPGAGTVGHRPYTKTLSQKKIAEGGELIFNEREVPLHARQCRLGLEEARARIFSALPVGSSTDWASHPIFCSIDYEAGCSPLRVTSLLSLPAEAKYCHASAESKDLIYHEFAHEVIERLTPVHAPKDASLNEALADTITFLITRNPRFASGFWKERQISWIRDHSEPREWMRINTYEDALAFSSAWWTIYEAVRAQIGEERASKLCLRVLLASIRLLRKMPTAHPLSIGAAVTHEAFGNDGEASFLPGISCTVRTTFANHGFIYHPHDCPPGEKKPGEAKKDQRKSGSEREWVLDLTVGLKTDQLAIPDAPDPTSSKLYEDWLELPYQFRLEENEVVLEASLELETSHLYNDDLWIAFSDPDVHEFFKGMGEFPLPKRMTISELSKPQGAILIRDTSFGLTGQIKIARLYVKVGRLDAKKAIPHDSP